MANDDSNLQETIRTDLTENLPGWTIEHGTEPLSIIGLLQLVESGKIIDEYKVRLQLSPSHPTNPPSVFEIGGKIDRIADHHINGDGSACLFVVDEKNKYWNKNTKISEFVSGPVRSYFISQSYYAATGEWIFGERRHEISGVLDFYYEQLEITSIVVLETMLQLVITDNIKGHWLCPCGSQKKMRQCHMQRILKLRYLVDRKRIQFLLDLFGKAKKEGREPSIRK